MKKPFHTLTAVAIVVVMLGSHSYAQAAPTRVTNSNPNHYGSGGSQDRASSIQGQSYDIRPKGDSGVKTAAHTLAFPGAEGFGANSLGGRGGKIIEVVNLNDSGPGSLRACVEANGPRICIFRTGGLIQLNSTLKIVNAYITIAGQTAPGGGITLKTTGSGADTLDIATHDVVVRYLTFRPGPGGENHGAQIASNGKALYNIMIDHCTFSWGVDSNIETWYRVYDTSIQWSIVSEALDCSTHSKGCHSKGIMIGGYAGSESKDTKGSEDISVHHNLIAHVGERAPLLQICGVAQIVNNVTYNTYWTFSHQQDNCPGFASYVNWIGNYHKKGPDSTSNSDLKVIPADSGKLAGGGAKVYVRGNIGPSRTDNSQPESNWVDPGSRSYIVTNPAPAPTITTTSALKAYKQVLASAGNSAGVACDGTWFKRRDSIDSRVVKSVVNKTGHIIDDPSQVGGWITPASGTPCTDSDHDGMPDIWEVKYALNPNDYSDAVADADGDGYTNIEEYINATSPKKDVIGETITDTFRSQAAYDGWALEKSENSNQGSKLNKDTKFFALGDDKLDRQYRSILSFNTASLPDNAVITKVTLKIKQKSVVGTNPFTTHGNLLVDVRKGAFGDNKNLQVSDFEAKANKDKVGAIPNKPKSSWYTKSWKAGILTYINQTGLTQLRLRFAKDDNDDMSADFLKFFSGDAAAASRPKLIIKYYVP
jgi:pectate lyase